MQVHVHENHRDFDCYPINSSRAYSSTSVLVPTDEKWIFARVGLFAGVSATIRPDPNCGCLTIDPTSYGSVCPRAAPVSFAV